MVGGEQEVVVMYCVAPVELMPSATEWADYYRRHALWKKWKLAAEEPDRKRVST